MRPIYPEHGSSFLNRSRVTGQLRIANRPSRLEYVRLKSWFPRPSMSKDTLTECRSMHTRGTGVHGTRAYSTSVAVVGSVASALKRDMVRQPLATLRSITSCPLRESEPDIDSIPLGIYDRFALIVTRSFITGTHHSLSPRLRRCSRPWRATNAFPPSIGNVPHPEIQRPDGVTSLEWAYIGKVKTQSEFAFGLKLALMEGDPDCSGRFAPAAQGFGRSAGRQAESLRHASSTRIGKMAA